LARQTIAAQLESARVIIEGALAGDATLTARLTQVGYNNAALGAAQALLNSFGDSRVNAYAQRGDQRGATDTLDALRQKVDAQYSTLAQIAKTIFADNADALTTLGLLLPKAPTLHNSTEAASDGPKASPRPSEAQSAVLDRCRLLYRGALAQATLLTELAKVGYTEARLETEWEDVEALEKADLTQESEKSEVRGSTADQKAKLAELNEWVSRFKGIVVPALKDRPDLLAKLGLKPRGGKR